MEAKGVAIEKALRGEDTENTREAYFIYFKNNILMFYTYDLNVNNLKWEFYGRFLTCQIYYAKLIFLKLKILYGTSCAAPVVILCTKIAYELIILIPTKHRWYVFILYKASYTKHNL